MTSELLKQLKDAGFVYKHPFRHYDTAYIVGEEPMPIPTLSELIEACDSPILFKDNDNWIAGVFSGAWDTWFIDDSLSDVVVDSTPEEAVARLWLVLNKK